MPALAPASLASNGSFLIKPGIGLMIWTLLVFGVTMFLLSQARLPARSARRSNAASEAIEESIDTAERTRAEADKLLAEYRERLKEARDAGRRDRPARAPGGRGARARGQGARPGDRRRGRQARRARHRGGDQARARRHPPRGRRPDDHGHREGDAQDARRRRPAAAGRGGAGELDFSDDLLGAGRGSEPELMEELARGIRPLAVRGRARAGQARRAARAARRSSPTRWTTTASWRCSSSRPTSPRKEKQDGARADARAAPTRCFLNFLELLIENHRMPVIFRIRQQYERLWERGEPPAPGGDHERDRARPGDDREPRPRDRRARRAQGDARGARRPRHPRRHRAAGWATRSSTPLSATDWSSCAGTLPKEPS